ncbi:hypothetical protein [Streptomyces coelicoflavus]|nr:hypothetical protein [Streptomyces coelicoflavus]EHN76477.1 hypothetical protein SMCF_4044 [Streptomyces coelicoflavus ZG0656]
MADVISRSRAARSDMVRWLAFSLVCAGGSLGLSWLGPVVPLPSAVRGVGGLFAVFLLPLASLLVPVLLLRRVPRKQRKVAWQLIVPPIAGVALGFLGTVAGEAAALADRGVSADAVVVSADHSSTNHCELRTVDGQDISPSLSESDGCRDATAKGDEVRVRYDPEGIASPDDGRTSSYGVLLATLFGAAVVMGTWGGVRQSRWDRAYGDA